MCDTLERSGGLIRFFRIDGMADSLIGKFNEWLRSVVFESMHCVTRSQLRPYNDYGMVTSLLNPMGWMWPARLGTTEKRYAVLAGGLGGIAGALWFFVRRWPLSRGGNSIVFDRVFTAVVLKDVCSSMEVKAEAEATLVADEQEDPNAKAIAQVQRRAKFSDDLRAMAKVEKEEAEAAQHIARQEMEAELEAAAIAKFAAEAASEKAQAEAEVKRKRAMLRRERLEARSRREREAEAETKKQKQIQRESNRQMEQQQEEKVDCGIVQRQALWENLPADLTLGAGSEKAENDSDESAATNASKSDVGVACYRRSFRSQGRLPRRSQLLGDEAACQTSMAH